MGSTKDLSHDYQLLLEAEGLSEGQLEEQSSSLLETATSVLSLTSSNYEVKLDCIRYAFSSLKTNDYFQLIYIFSESDGLLLSSLVMFLCLSWRIQS